MGAAMEDFLVAMAEVIAINTEATALEDLVDTADELVKSANIKQAYFSLKTILQNFLTTT